MCVMCVPYARCYMKSLGTSCRLALKNVIHTHTADVSPSLATINKTFCFDHYFTIT